MTKRFSWKIFRSFLPLVLACASIVQAAEPSTAVTDFFKQLKAGKKETVIIYGTSLSKGGAWAGAVKQWFDEKFPGKVNFINSSGPGQNSDWGVAGLRKNVLENHPDLIFIEFSYNDAHDKFHMPVDKGAKNLDKIVKGILAKNPHAAIVLQVMNVGWDAPNGNRSFSVRPELQKFNDNYRKYAKENDLPLIDHYPAWEHLKETDPETFHKYVPDGTHPNPEGSLAVTWPAVQKFLEDSLNGS